MITFPGIQNELLFGLHYNVHLDIQIVPVGGGVFSPTQQLLSGKVSGTMDQACNTFELTFSRGKGGLAENFDNLSPLISASNWNVNGPLMYGGNFIVISCCVTPQGVPPDIFTAFFIGRIDGMDAGGDTVVINGRDAGAFPLLRQIKNPAPYGPSQMEDIIVAIAAANGTDPAGIQIDVITDFTINQYMQQPGSLLLALRTIAQQRGLDFRYFTNRGLRLYDPDRERVVPDGVFSADEYITVDRLVIDDADVRNQVEVWYDHGLPTMSRVYVEDAASILQHGQQFVRLVMSKSARAFTLAQATAFANYALADMKDPLADHQVTVPFFPAVELNDFHEYVANQDHYDQNQKWAIATFDHEFDLGGGTTKFGTRGKPMAAFRDYRRGAEDMNVMTDQDPPTGTYLDGVVFPEGFLWLKTPDVTIAT